MARILALDTTAEFGSIAYHDSERDVLSEIAMHSPEGFGHILFDGIARLLERQAITVDDIDCFASASGPGSFTGVRVGLTAAKGLAEAAERRVAVVSNLRALAWFGSAPLRATVLDARRGEVYGALYGSDLESVQEERVMKFPVWLDGLPPGEMEFVGTNMAPFAPVIEASRFRGARLIDAPRVLAGAIARIAHADFIRGTVLDPAAVDANYVRRSDAELLWRE